MVMCSWHTFRGTSRRLTCLTMTILQVSFGLLRHTCLEKFRMNLIGCSVCKVKRRSWKSARNVNVPRYWFFARTPSYEVTLLGRWWRIATVCSVGASLNIPTDKIFELFHPFKGLIMILYMVVVSCILISRHDHVLCSQHLHVLLD